MPPRDHTDDQLVLGLQAGSSDAFERIYAEYHAPIYNLCARVLCDREEAQDVTQDVFIKAYRNPPMADERLNLRAWLYRVATNACYDTLRLRGRRGMSGDDQLEAVPDAVDQFDRAQTAALVEESLEQLNERYRTALVLKDLHGLRPAEIAAVMQVSRPTADVLVHRARASFRTAFRRLAGRDAAAPASLGLALLPLSVPAALHVAPPLPAPPVPGGGQAAPHAPLAPASPHTGVHLPALPDPSSLAGPGAAGLLSRLGDAVGTKAAATAAAATLLIGGGLVVNDARHGDAHKTSFADAAVRAGEDHHGTATGHWAGHGGWHSFSRWAGHGIEADAHNGEHVASGHHDATHADATHDGTHDDGGTAAHDGATTTHDSSSSTTHESGGTSTVTSGDHVGDTTTHDGSDGGGDSDHE